MSLTNELRSEIKEAKKLRLSWQTKVIVFIVSAALTFLFALHGRLAWAWPLMITIGVLGLVILFKRKLWNQRWFWVDGSYRDASYPADSVRSLDHELGSRTGNLGRRLSRFLRDPLDSSCCREVNGGVEGL
jgi:hypothetical protein